MHNTIYKYLWLFVFSFTVFMSAEARLGSDPDITSLLTSTQQRLGIPSMQLSILTPAKGIETYLVGHMSIKADSPQITNKSLYQIGSSTKTFVASILLMLEEESKKGELNVNFSLSQTLGRWFPEYDAWADIKVRQLLNMTSGIPNYTAVDELVELLLGDPLAQFTPEQLVDYAYEQDGTLFEPGKGFYYSNTNYILAGMLIEKITNKPFEAVLSEKILTPLKLNNTFYLPNQTGAYFFDRIAHGYFIGADNMVDVTNMNLTWAGTAGAMISNSEDMAKWMRALFKGKVLSKKQLAKMTKVVCMADVPTNACQAGEPITRNSNDFGYGLGIMRSNHPEDGSKIWSHAGMTLGYQSNPLYLERDGSVITLLIGQALEFARMAELDQFIAQLLQL